MISAFRSKTIHVRIKSSADLIEISFCCKLCGFLGTADRSENLEIFFLNNQLKSVLHHRKMYFRGKILLRSKEYRCNCNKYNTRLHYIQSWIFNGLLSHLA